MNEGKLFLIYIIKAKSTLYTRERYGLHSSIFSLHFALVMIRVARICNYILNIEYNYYSITYDHNIGYVHSYGKKV